RKFKFESSNSITTFMIQLRGRSINVDVNRRRWQPEGHVKEDMFWGGTATQQQLVLDEISGPIRNSSYFNPAQQVPIGQYWNQNIARRVSFHVVIDFDCRSGRL